MKNQSDSGTSREVALRKFDYARRSLILMIALTLINIVLFAIGSDSMLLFSATVPFYAVIFGVVSEIPALLIAGFVVAAIALGLYLLCWLCSKRHYGWMITALVMFILDSLFLILFSLLAGDFSGTLDFVIHVLILYYLITGVKYGAQLKRMSEEEEPSPSV